MKKSTVVALAVSLLVAVAGTFVTTAWYFTQDGYPDGVVSAEIESEVLRERRQYAVHLPDSYGAEPAGRFPVIYVLDGSSQDVHTAASAAVMARAGVIPELIVVGVPSGGSERRDRDYTPPFMGTAVDDPASPKGAGDRFLAFLKTELIPEIERRYRTSDVRMLMGHSRGGLLAAYSLMAEPDLFHARFVHSAPVWRYDALLVNRLSEFLATAPETSSFLYVSVGGGETEQMIGGYERLRNALAGGAPASLRWDADTIPGAVHGNNGERAMPRGLRAWHRNAAPDHGQVP